MPPLPGNALPTGSYGISLSRAAGHNIEAGAAGLDDLAPVRVALGLGVPMADISLAVKCVHSQETCSTNPPAMGWRSQTLLRKIAEIYVRSVIVPSMVAAMESAGKASQKPAARVELPPEPQDAPAASREKPPWR
jgi:hypothetical protein